MRAALCEIKHPDNDGTIGKKNVLNEANIYSKPDLPEYQTYRGKGLGPVNWGPSKSNREVHIHAHETRI